MSNVYGSILGVLRLFRGQSAAKRSVRPLRRLFPGLREVLARLVLGGRLGETVRDLPLGGSQAFERTQSHRSASPSTVSAFVPLHDLHVRPCALLVAPLLLQDRDEPFPPILITREDRPIVFSVSSEARATTTRLSSTDPRKDPGKRRRLSSCDLPLGPDSSSVLHECRRPPSAPRPTTRPAVTTCRRWPPTPSRKRLPGRCPGSCNMDSTKSSLQGLLPRSFEDTSHDRASRSDRPASPALKNTGYLLRSSDTRSDRGDSARIRAAEEGGAGFPTRAVLQRSASMRSPDLPGHESFPEYRVRPFRDHFESTSSTYTSGALFSRSTRACGREDTSGAPPCGALRSFLPFCSRDTVSCPPAARAAPPWVPFRGILCGRRPRTRRTCSRPTKKSRWTRGISRMTASPSTPPKHLERRLRRLRLSSAEFSAGPTSRPAARPRPNTRPPLHYQKQSSEWKMSPNRVLEQKTAEVTCACHVNKNSTDISL